MSASIYAEPVQRKKDYLPIGAPSSFLSALEKVFGTQYPVLGPGDVPKLEVVFALGGYEHEALAILRHLITTHGAVQLSASY